MGKTKRSVGFVGLFKRTNSKEMGASELPILATHDEIVVEWEAWASRRSRVSMGLRREGST
jgi:hypothetical protein